MLDFSAIRTSLFGPPTTSMSQPPTVAYKLPSSAGGDFVAASNSVAESTSAVVTDSLPSTSSLQPCQRLARFQFDPATGNGVFVPVVPNDPSLVGKDVIVLVHGWGPDYSYWVNDVANNPAPGLPSSLTWWDTDPGQPGYNLSANLLANQQADTILDPASYFSLHGYNNLGIDVADTGLAQEIAARDAKVDPKAVVLAYSWIDDSGTSSRRRLGRVLNTPGTKHGAVMRANPSACLSVSLGVDRNPATPSKMGSVVFSTPWVSTDPSKMGSVGFFSAWVPAAPSKMGSVVFSTPSVSATPSKMGSVVFSTPSVFDSGAGTVVSSIGSPVA